MAEKNEGNACGCSCICDPTVPRMFDQSAARYNDRSSYANNNQQDNQTLLLSMFQAQAQNALEQTPRTNTLENLAFLSAVIGGKFPVGT